MSAALPSHPILSCAEAKRFEAEFFGKDEAKEWSAMQQAGRAVAREVLRDFQEIGGFPADGRVLVLVGKGHNGGDALIAAQTVLEQFPQAQAEVMFFFGERSLRPLAARAWRDLADSGRARVSVNPAHKAREKAYALCLDGVFGFQFRPPLDEAVKARFAAIARLTIRLRAAVDLPSGLGAEGAFRADFTYATGIVKSPVTDPVHTGETGRRRYLDLGFFAQQDVPAEARVLTPEVLAPLARLRASDSDKRTYGHIFLLGGSRGYPGAILMATLAALHSGAGLVTAFVPESLAAAYAARAPEAMWVAWPETPAGGLSLEGQHLFEARVERASAVLIGPGLGREPETLALVTDLVTRSKVPLLLDADALQPDIVRAGRAPRIVTPHAGEFKRIAEGAELTEFAQAANATVILKGPVTKIAGPASSQIYHAFAGGPVLARGGSGDLLAGVTGGLLAQTPKDPLLAAARGAVWHGLAADALARAHGQVSVPTTQLLDFFGPVLREL